MGLEEPCEIIKVEPIRRTTPAPEPERKPEEAPAPEPAREPQKEPEKV